MFHILKVNAIFLYSCLQIPCRTFFTSVGRKDEMPHHKTTWWTSASWTECKAASLALSYWYINISPAMWLNLSRWVTKIHCYLFTFLSPSNRHPGEKLKLQISEFSLLPLGCQLQRVKEKTQLNEHVRIDWATYMLWVFIWLTVNVPSDWHCCAIVWVFSTYCTSR